MSAANHNANFAVIGAGVMGLAAAHALGRAGQRVTVYEQFERGHARGSSHGRSRIFRLAYYEPEWVRLAQEALTGWRDLERDSGQALLDLDGLVEIVDDLAQSSVRALDACGVAWQRLERDEVARRFPLRLPDGAFGVLQPEAGIVHADRALAAFERGLDVRYGARIASLDDLREPVVIVTAGAWINDLVAPRLPVRVTRETVCYFRCADPRTMPALVSFNRPGDIVFYALRDPRYGIKAAGHHAGRETDPNEPGEPDQALAERIAAWLSALVPLAERQPAEVQTCLYTTTADERFILERRGRIVVGSACSGHGFKFAPAIGARLARLAMETSQV